MAQKCANPFHSVTQFPHIDPNGGEVTPTRLQFGLGKIYDWIKKVGSFFHLSCLGSGHTESIHWASTNGWILPQDTRYEVSWWDRTTKFDGVFSGLKGEQNEALECANGYAWQVSIGNLTCLRRFLKVSLEKSYNRRGYITRFVEDLIVPSARDLVSKGLCKILKTTDNVWRPDKINKWLPQVTNYLLGWTRQRKVLHPAWADDNLLWV